MNNSDSIPVASPAAFRRESSSGVNNNISAAVAELATSSPSSASYRYRSYQRLHQFRLAFKGARRMACEQSYRPALHMNPTYDIVVITGGSRGLGYELAIILAQKKSYTVIILDIRIPELRDRIPEAVYYECDVSKIDQITRVAEDILETYGTVTILINNAGIMRGAKPTVELSFQEIKSTLEVNLLSNFLTVKIFVPGMISRRRGYVVTIGSVLGYVSPAKLSLYGASKAGLVALHESLTHELGPPASEETGVHTLLVCPGQLRTTLFNEVKSPYVIIAPVLNPQHVARSIVMALESGKTGELKLPLYVRGIPLLRLLPRQLATAVRAISGVDSSL